MEVTVATLAGAEGAGTGVHSLAGAGSPRIPLDAAHQPRVAVTVTRTAAPLPGAPGGLARANATDADVSPAAPRVIRAVASLVGAAGSSGGAIAVPGTNHRCIGSNTLVISPAGFAGSRATMMRRDLRQAAAGCRQQRSSTNQGAQEASP